MDRALRERWIPAGGPMGKSASDSVVAQAARGSGPSHDKLVAPSLALSLRRSTRREPHVNGGFVVIRCSVECDCACRPDRRRHAFAKRDMCSSQYDSPGEAVRDVLARGRVESFMRRGSKRPPPPAGETGVSGDGESSRLVRTQTTTGPTLGRADPIHRQRVHHGRIEQVRIQHYWWNPAG